jgi:exodeoxyribonuclease VII large subunit
MAIFYKIENEFIIFFGDTFNHRPAIKAMGARFNGTDKTWVLKDSSEARAQAAQFARLMPGAPVAKTSSNGVHISSEPTAPRASKQNLSLEVDPSLGLSISQLMNQADQIISQGFPTPIWVIGEIQSLNKKSSGVIFFDFADAKTGAHQTATVTVKCNVWQSSFNWLLKRHGKEKVESVFQDGNNLRALVHVKLYKDRGQISLTVEDIDPAFTQGALALARLELLKKLRSLGLDRKNKNLLMPPFPFKVALITAPESRAYSDFVHQLTSQSEFPGTLFFIPCSMQGDQVPLDVTKAIAKAIDLDVDVIVLSRGGGSAADLRWFDGEEIALAIANATVPVIAAIGHHDDNTVAEDVAFLREKTPTAAADRIIEIFRDTRKNINERAHTLAVSLDREISRFEMRQSDLRERLAHASELYFSRHRERLSMMLMKLERSFDELLSTQKSNFLHAAFQMNHAAQTCFQKMTEELFDREQKLIRLDPNPWLDAGWTQLSVKGKPVRSIDDIEVSSELFARIRDGVLKLNVTSKESRSPKRK